MGTKGKELVEMDIDELVKLLNKALADEWLAYYQYWIGAKVLKGPMRGQAAAELEEHAAEELEHAEMLTERIIQLDGTPLLKPEDWYDMTNCGYEAPEDPSVRVVLKQNMEGEQCAIDVYREILKKTRDKAPITYMMILEILGDEVEHEEDLQAILEDLNSME
ncbi:MAG: ferritin-like domain-containing protein [Thermoproteota archaeon]